MACNFLFLFPFCASKIKVNKKGDNQFKFSTAYREKINFPAQAWMNYI